MVFKAFVEKALISALEVNEQFNIVIFFIFFEIMDTPIEVIKKECLCPPY